MRIGVFVPNWVGDVAMATPTLRALRQRFPAARIVGVVRPYVADVLAGSPWLDEQIFYHPRAADRGQRFAAVLRQLRDEQLDAAVLLTNSFRTAALAWASGARRRVGYVRYGRGPLLTDKLYQPRRAGKWLPIPAIDAYLQLAYALGCPWESSRLELATSAADEAAADAVWRRHDLPPREHMAVLNSSGAYGAAKLWPTSYFAELARRLAQEQQMGVLVACGPAERELAAEIVKRRGPSPRGEPGRQGGLAGPHESLYPPQPPVGDHRQRATILRRRVRRQRRFAVRSNRRRLDAHPLRRRNLPAACRALRTVRAADMPTRAPRLHAVVVGRASVRGRLPAVDRSPDAGGLSRGARHDTAS